MQPPLKRDSNKKLTKNPREAACAIQQGGVVAYPTETLYGLGVNAISRRAVEKIYALKERPKDKPLSIAVASPKTITELCQVDSLAQSFIERFLPGPFTILLKPRVRLPQQPGLIGIRYPDHPLTLELIRLTGTPITATSANRSGEVPPVRWQDIEIEVDLVLQGECSYRQPSTVIDLTNREILRKGVRWKEALEFLGKFPNIY